MYIPNRYKIKDPSVAHDFMKKYAFATLFANTEEGMEAVHIPLQTEVREDQLYLEGHVARANRIGQLAENHSEVLAVFSQPHAYVSSSWYDDINVPTWNYIAVHATGKLRQLHDEELIESLKRLTHTYEDGRPDRFYVEDMPDDMLKAHLKGLIGFEIKVDKLEAKHKLSQNRNDKDFKNIIEKLKLSSDPLEQEIAKEMEQLNNNS